jgi:hypothetical protein
LSLGHRRVKESSRSVLINVFDSVGNFEGERLFSESQVLGGDLSVEENVDTYSTRMSVPILSR